MYGELKTNSSCDNEMILKINDIYTYNYSMLLLCTTFEINKRTVEI